MEQGQELGRGKKGFFKGILAIVFIAIAALILFISPSLVETNEAGYYQVKQAFYTGTLTVRDAPGTYGQMAGSIETYELAKDIHLSKSSEDGGENNKAERVLFPDGYADINFVGMYELSLDDAIQKDLHIMFNNDETIQKMVTEQIVEALKNTGTLMTAEEAYSNKRADFIKLAREQALKGLYKSHVETEMIETASGQRQAVKHYSVALDTLGNPIIMKESLLAKYDIILPKYNVKDMDFDEILVGLIEGRKNTQKAIQDAITEKAKGDIKIAKTKAEEESSKIREVTIAQKLKEVAVLNSEKERMVASENLKRDELNAKATLVLKKAEAEGDKLKVAAGLSPLEAATIEKETRIGMAKEIFGGNGITFPQTLISGSDKNGKTIDPFTAVGLESLKNMVNGKVTSKK